MSNTVDTPARLVYQELLTRPAPFKIDDLFFSVTDLQSTILYGNDAFFSIAEYEREELIGQYHNTIRHPAMPKAAFKLLWSYLQAGKGTGAYVVNRTKTGKYYWVFGIFSPVIDDTTGEPFAYISVRLKPQSSRVKAITAIYEEMLNIEQSEDVNASLAYLHNALNKLGFADYDAFVTDSMSIETDEFIEQDFFVSLLQKNTLQMQPGNVLLSNLRGLRKGIKQLDHGVKSLYDVKKALVDIRELLEGTKHFFSIVRDTSMNLAISSGQLKANSSRVLGPIVTQLIDMAENGESMMDEFEKMANSLIDNHKTLTYDANKVLFYSSAYHNDLMAKAVNAEVDDIIHAEDDSGFQPHTRHANSEHEHANDDTTNSNNSMVEQAISNVTMQDLERLEEFVQNYVLDIQNLSDLVIRKLGYMLTLGRSLTVQGTVLAEEWDATGVLNNLNGLQQDIMTIETKLDNTAMNFSQVLNTMNILKDATRTNVDAFEQFSSLV